MKKRATFLGYNPSAVGILRNLRPRGYAHGKQAALVGRGDPLADLVHPRVLVASQTTCDQVLLLLIGDPA